jgi:general secretion pathway protein A
VKKIFRYSGGLPRLINIVCDRALLSAYADDAREVSAATVSAAIRELRRQSPKNTGLRRLAAVLGCLLLIIPFLGDTLAAVPRSIAVFVSLAVPVLGGYLALLPEAPSPSSSPPAVVAAAVAESSPEPHSPLDPDLLCRKLAETDERPVSARAFNALAALWKVETEPVESGLDVPFELQKACDSRSLRLSGFRGTLEELVHLDTPALLQISLPGESGRRYLALIRVEEGRALVAPAPEREEWLELESLRRLWGGRAYIVWKNFQELPSKTSPGDAGDDIRRLQGLLRAAGVYARKESGLYDAATIAAVKRFQSEQGLATDGKVGPQTLIALYQEVAGQSPTIGAPRPGGEE